MSKATIRAVLLVNRPALSEGSLKTYASIIDNLSRRVWPNTEFDGERFDDPAPVLASLAASTINTRKTVLSSLVIYTLGKPTVSAQYREVMMAEAQKYLIDEREQKMTETQQKNWVTQTEVAELFTRLGLETAPLFSMYAKKPPGGVLQHHMELIQSYVVLALYHEIPPRRLKDFTEMKVRDFNVETDNYMTKGSLVFNKYKTSSTYGTQTVKMPVKLKNLLAKYVALGPNEYLLYNPRTGKPLTNVQLNAKIGHVFGKPVSVNILRHSFLSTQYQNAPPLADMQANATAMGHSVLQALTYVKLDAPVAMDH